MAARVSPNLSYLTIYNPTLKPDDSVPKSDDEDAEEQAQILFYTSKERAASRDTMLRQIGLAKALASFSEMFSSGESCDSVHSQTRRMIMVCPEPDFWIHASVELAKTPRPPTITKANSKGKGKEKQATSAMTYDYSDASVHDMALNADLTRGYERFKLMHGSFTSVLESQGRIALELQLERFFTVWAWSWDIDSGYGFGDHLGVPLHPTHTAVTPALDQFSSTIPDNLAPIFATPTHIIPSKRYLDGRFPTSLSRHILSLVPPPEPSNNGLITDLESTLRLKKPPDPHKARSNPDSKFNALTLPSQNSGSFMGIPTGNLHVKWNWPDVLTFGKTSQAAPRPTFAVTPGVHEKRLEDGAADDGIPSAHGTPSEVDRNALDDAMSSETVPPEPPVENPTADPSPQVEDEVESEEHDEVPPSPPTPTPPPTPPRSLSSAPVHIADPLNPLLTKKRKIYYLTQPGRAIILASLDDNQTLEAETPESLSVKVDQLFSEIDKVTNDPPKSASSDGTTPVSKLLQQKDQYIMTLPNFTLSTSSSDKPFASRSQHLFNAQMLLETDSDIKEVFSRGQNPQHWHVGRKIKDGEEVYMEVFSKEASLTDVDNNLSGIVRRLQGSMDM